MPLSLAGVPPAVGISRLGAYMPSVLAEDIAAGEAASLSMRADDLLSKTAVWTKPYGGLFFAGYRPERFGHGKTGICFEYSVKYEGKVRK